MSIRVHDLAKHCGISNKEMIEKLGGFNGGFIAGFYGDPGSIGINPEWQDWACEAFVEFGGGN